MQLTEEEAQGAAEVPWIPAVGEACQVSILVAEEPRWADAVRVANPGTEGAAPMLDQEMFRFATDRGRGQVLLSAGIVAECVRKVDAPRVGDPVAYHPATPPHPIQPLLPPGEKGTRDGGPRFKGNGIVRFLLSACESHGVGLNEISADKNAFSQEDREQFAQLIGYSLGGFGELSYVRDETYDTAERMWQTGETEEQARIAVLEAALAKVKDGLRPVATELFGVHPDDLRG